MAHSGCCLSENSELILQVPLSWKPVSELHVRRPQLAIHTESCPAERPSNWTLLSNGGYLTTFQEQGVTLLLYQLQIKRGRKIKAQTKGPSKPRLELSFPEASRGQQLVGSVATSCCPAPSSSLDDGASSLPTSLQSPRAAGKASFPRGALALWPGRSAHFLTLASIALSEKS